MVGQINVCLQVGWVVHRPVGGVEVKLHRVGVSVVWIPLEVQWLRVELLEIFLHPESIRRGDCNCYENRNESYLEHFKLILSNILLYS
jgi:hypothetical protein